MQVKQIFAFCLTLSLLIAMTGCVSTPDTGADYASIKGQEVKHREKPVKWGGVIVQTHNFRETTEIEIVAYPTDIYGAPKTRDEPLGRFIARKRGYLESADFAPGRRITVNGTILGSKTGKVGEASYNYPLVLAHDLKLWRPSPSSSGSRPNVHFGFGIHSGGGSNVGIGIGF